jgi:hypothetical protein
MELIRRFRLRLKKQAILPSFKHASLLTPSVIRGAPNPRFKRERRSLPPAALSPWAKSTRPNKKVLPFLFFFLFMFSLSFFPFSPFGKHF